MVAVLGAEAVEDDLVAVGDVVAVGVLEEHDVRLLGDIDAAVTQLEARRHVEAAGEDGVVIGAAVAVPVLENHDLVVGFLVRQPLRIGGHRRHPQPAPGVERQRHRVADRKVLFGGEQRDLVALGGVEVFQRVCRIAGFVAGLAAAVRFLVADVLGDRRAGSESRRQEREERVAVHRSIRSSRQTSPERARSRASSSSSSTSSSKRTISGGKE